MKNLKKLKNTQISRIFSFNSNKNLNNILKITNKDIHFINTYNINQSLQNTFQMQKKFNKANFIKIQIKCFSKEENHKLNPYLILEVNKGSDFKTIKAAYFKLARLYHPDTNNSDEVNLYKNRLL